jgi:hypothetical protein
MVALAVLIPLGRFMYIATPGGTGFAAKHLCSLVFVSGLDPDRAMEIYVKPAIFPLASFLSYEVDRESRTIRTESFGGLSDAEAAYRPGCGCTVLHESSVGELRTAFTPPATAPTGIGWEIDAEHRRLSFDEAALERAIDEGFAEPDGGGRNTLAVVVLHDGRLVAERYASGIDAATPLPGWSMTKSVTATLVGILARDGLLDVKAPAGFPEWSADDDPRRSITLDHLLRMTAGLGISWWSGSAPPAWRVAPTRSPPVSSPASAKGPLKLRSPWIRVGELVCRVLNRKDAKAAKTDSESSFSIMLKTPSRSLRLRGESGWAGQQSTSDPLS